MSSREWRERNPEKARSYSRKWRKANPDKARSESKRQVEKYKRYSAGTRGVPKELVEAAVEAKRKHCWICGAGPDAQKFEHVVDHDHVTGAFRGILCGRCNSALGMLWDSPELCEAAARYLRDPPGVRGLTDPDACLPKLSDLDVDT